MKPLTGGPGRARLRDRKQKGGCQGLGEGFGRGSSKSLMGTQFQFRKMKKFWKCMMPMAAQECDCTVLNTTESYT